MSEQDIRFMRLALALGRRGQGCVWPNPAVGCVLVQGERIVGRGWTGPTGRPHAETVAIARAGHLARGATAYVSLEPCDHHGRTGPCSMALLEAGVSRVVVAMEDPDPRVSGAGFARLRAGGVDVTVGVLDELARRDHAGFLLRLSRGRPLVTLKLATSFDGRIATATGHSQWITGPNARRMVHAMRARHDAVMVGGGTARADDPSLTVRDLGIDEQPVRVVMSRRLDLPLMGQLARSARTVPVWICHGPDVPVDTRRAWEEVGARLIPCPLRGAALDIGAALEALGSAGLTRVFCEGGGMLAASLLEAGLVDRLVGFTAGFSIGAEGSPGIGALGLERLDEACRFELEETRPIGGDLLHCWIRARPTPD